ncbi:tetratricopeptide repeat protein 19, mitochondrial [Neosynchiropus ocellatus]
MAARWVFSSSRYWMTRFLSPADLRRTWCLRVRRTSVAMTTVPAVAEVQRGSQKERKEENKRRREVLSAALALSLFGKQEQKDEVQEKHDEMVLLLKKAKLSIYRGNMEDATDFLHKAVVLAHQLQDQAAIIYTYIQMANLAFVLGQLDSAEKLFKAAMSFMLSGGTAQDDNSIIEMSLKLATIYAEQNKKELAEHGFRFCLDSLEAKLKKLCKQPPGEDATGDVTGHVLSEEEEDLRKETRLLLGLCFDSRARYRISFRQLDQAETDYRSALDICAQEQGESHPQTLVLMSDLATVLDLQGRYDEALLLVQKAVDLGRIAGNEDQHVLLSNLAGVLLHKGRYEEAERIYKEAMLLAKQVGDQVTQDQVQESLEELKRRKQK